MASVNIGNKIRELRKKKGITQETLAAALSVSPQAVSKWESGLTYPDMTMIPVIAGYFEISLDILFEYDIAQMKNSIQKIIDNARGYFFSEPLRYAETISAALQDYPGNEALLTALIEAYEYDLRENGNADNLDDIIEISQKLISESSDFVRICDAKELQAIAYLKKGDYEKAKEVLESLPRWVTLQKDAIKLHLKGKDKLNAAIWSRCDHLQALYTACIEEGNAWFRMDRENVTFHDGTIPEEYIPEALKCYQKGAAVIELFLNERYEGQAQYLWNGMQTFHWTFYQRIAACHKRLGNTDECEKAIETAYRIISSSWDDFDENKAEYMKPFNQYLKDYGLEEYIQ